MPAQPPTLPLTTGEICLVCRLLSMAPSSRNAVELGSTCNQLQSAVEDPPICVTFKSQQESDFNLRLHAGFATTNVPAVQ